MPGITHGNEIVNQMRLLNCGPEHEISNLTKLISIGYALVVGRKSAFGSQTYFGRPSL